MAVYTDVSDGDLAAFVSRFDLGAVLSCKGIAEGVENSNFLLVTEAGPHILTLYEKRVREHDLPFFLGLMRHLAERDVSCPLPVPDREGAAWGRLCSKPAAIVTFLPGLWLRRPQPAHCAEVGRALAHMHVAGLDFALTRRNDLSVDDWPRLFDPSAPDADTLRPGLADGIAAELEALKAAWPDGLPRGVIHGDLFPDNVFFQDSRLTGLIDFYFACTDLLAYDLAVCLNAWCFEADGAFNITKARALLSGYNAVRPLSAGELDALPVLARGAAMRFLLTRLHDWLNRVEGALVKVKDPLEYWTRLRFHAGVHDIAAYGLDRVA